jgi:hypothetical protein
MHFITCRPFAGAGQDHGQMAVLTCAFAILGLRPSISTWKLSMTIKIKVPYLCQ